MPSCKLITLYISIKLELDRKHLTHIRLEPVLCQLTKHHSYYRKCYRCSPFNLLLIANTLGDPTSIVLMNRVDYGISITRNKLV